MPQDLGDATGLLKLMKAFQEKGFDANALEKITYENWLRILRKTWR